ncbi:MucR family transcriptional regulator (plasmid) [Sinorhizobium numidicum]|uniref:MucR family transcriptional regulator n=1 Tax=Sinorhizobium numidicum TaxID=680248 RepID=A0ABY8D5J8_9HYPH|nr:MucR family transcriptional regulator [Sinorhizobium numidicum]WEX79639.1 MucR family transcriptional regulator [Sinorhizobium numidicum]WEX85407.1 MucR family transcriptional regulator [Sinorhizobium numidicum]
MAPVGHPKSKEEPVFEEWRRAIPVRKPGTEDFIICLEDGKKFKLLRRHLMAKYGLTPEQYRRKWRLPAGYPTTAPSYVRERSELLARQDWGRYWRGAAHPPSARPAHLNYHVKLQER